MKDFKFCFVLFFLLAFHSLIAQTDYNKVDEKEKRGLEGFYPVQKLGMGTFEHGKEIGVLVL
jgi:hypothetical protein